MAANQKKKNSITAKAGVQETMEVQYTPAPKEQDPCVEYMIPLMPGVDSANQFFEYNRNGVNYRFRRGVLLHHPKSLADAVMRKVQMSMTAANVGAAFLNGGMRLN